MGYSKTFTVRWADCDANGHMRNTAYSEYAIEVRIGFLSEHGFGFEQFVAANLGPVLLREEIDYQREVRLGQTVAVDFTALGLSADGSRFKLAHDFQRGDGKAAGRIVLWGGWMDLGARRIVPPPPALLAAIQAVPRAPGWQELPPRARGP
ncbi:MAG TPA: acyl-CoA thioesterase [Anaeromyxobacteraceae bacterium]|nr:acyl-CoA thioesterase [Anaeromyxobacteraceae bacterium]